MSESVLIVGIGALGSLFAAMLAATLVYPIFIEIYSEPEAGTLISGYLGLVLMIR